MDEQTPAEVEHNQLLIRMLGGEPNPEPAEPEDPDTPPDFDAGVRDPVPDPEDPATAHNELVAMFAKLGGGP